MSCPVIYHPPACLHTRTHTRSIQAHTIIAGRKEFHLHLPTPAAWLPTYPLYSLSNCTVTSPTLWYSMDRYVGNSSVSPPPHLVLQSQPTTTLAVPLLTGSPCPPAPRNRFRSEVGNCLPGIYATVAVLSYFRVDASAATPGGQHQQQVIADSNREQQ